jgi:hypothetical protein
MISRDMPLEVKKAALVRLAVPSCNDLRHLKIETTESGNKARRN